MTLILTVLRCPDAVYPETRHVAGGELRIGRGPDNDWVLADPERHLSKRHCIVAFHHGGWAVADISTNGTFVNDGTAPLGHGTIRELRSGDRIRIGTYEIEAQIAPADPETLMNEVGATFRAMVSGLRQALIARATIKGEFRIEQTMIRARGNNPLKFSAHDDDALCALLGLGRRVDMRPDTAVSETLRDMRLHELATMAAMQGAVRAVMTRLDPARLRVNADEAGGMALLPAQKKARAFDIFEKEYRTVSNGLADNFDAVFGQAFARAYETALQDIQDRGAS
ncbi:type VI secretion system-associated FHA domain protein TagH [Acetobacter okinawensis]|uniref:type VI secretion system-associated FHA domain protein TagH n=1 Tax=Acetobacter okinawensis TaxID=1076594 RepID=UPI001BA8C61A|nr:type VI secretion system-associated FHA domain protein TagH [Acetobacter okinawensis]MBS0987604.1 type VI secretion system-associated FHA domain protein TagH [Acetobacter okinawensis]